jgi:hypothetical protein
MRAFAESKKNGTVMFVSCQDLNCDLEVGGFQAQIDANVKKLGLVNRPSRGARVGRFQRPVFFIGFTPNYRYCSVSDLTGRLKIEMKWLLILISYNEGSASRHIGH